MSGALLWGAIAASSLVLGSLLGLARQWHDGLIGVVLGFGAGALISSISFELAAEGLGWAGHCHSRSESPRERWHSSSPIAGSSGWAVGSAAERPGCRSPWAPCSTASRAGRAGARSGPGEGVSVALLVAIFVSNLPESIGSATDMKAGGVRPRVIILLWMRWPWFARSPRWAGMP